MKSHFTALKKIIDDHRSFLLSTHVNPDADALGSELAFYLILRKLGKKARIVNHSATPYNLEFLDEEKVIEKFDPAIHENIFNESEVFILLDLNQTGRIIRMENGFLSFQGVKVCIDHHQDPEEFFNLYVGNTDYAATSEIIYDFIKDSSIVEIDYSIALQLYAGIMTDTGSFRFERTSPKIHRLIAGLLETGINPTGIYDKIYNQFRSERLKLLGEALSTMSVDSTGQIAYMVITSEALQKAGAEESEIDGFVNYCLSIQGVRLGILFYEFNGGVKISFRSKDEIPVNKLAAEFNGGGHTNASGSRLVNVKINEIKERIISAAQKYL